MKWGKYFLLISFPLLFEREKESRRKILFSSFTTPFFLFVTLSSSSFLSSFLNIFYFLSFPESFFLLKRKKRKWLGEGNKKSRSGYFCFSVYLLFVQKQKVKRKESRRTQFFLNCYILTSPSEQMTLVIEAPYFQLVPFVIASHCFMVPE